MYFLPKEFWTFLQSFLQSLNLDFWQSFLIILSIIVVFLFFKNIKTVIEVIGISINWIISKFRKKRSCGDCALLMINTVTDTMKRKKDITDYILDEQMNYVELKIEILILDFLTSYKEKQLKLRNQNKTPDYVMEQKEYLLYQEGLHNALRLVVKEIKRSFKENGFHYKSGKEFADYVKEKSKELISIGKKYLMSCYPSENMIVSLKGLFDGLDTADIEDKVFDIFINAKEIKIKSIQKINEIDEEFKENINKFVNNKI